MHTRTCTHAHACLCKCYQWVSVSLSVWVACGMWHLNDVFLSQSLLLCFSHTIQLCVCVCVCVTCHLLCDVVCMFIFLSAFFVYYLLDLLCVWLRLWCHSCSVLHWWVWLLAGIGVVFCTGGCGYLLAWVWCSIHIYLISN